MKLIRIDSKGFCGEERAGERCGDLLKYFRIQYVFGKRNCRLVTGLTGRDLTIHLLKAASV